MLTSHTVVQYLVPYSCDCVNQDPDEQHWFDLNSVRDGAEELSLVLSLLRYFMTISQIWKPASGRHGGRSSLVYLARDTFVLSVFFRFQVLLFELDSKKTNWTGFYLRQANLCANSLWQLEQSRHALLIRVFQPQNLGHEYSFPDGKGLVSSSTIKILSLTVLAMDIPTAFIWSLIPSSSSIRACNSAVEFSLRFQSYKGCSEPSRVPTRSFSKGRCHNSLPSGRGGAPSSNA